MRNACVVAIFGRWAWDEKGRPTADEKGEPLSKSAADKAVKLLQKQAKEHGAQLPLALAVT